MKPIIGIISNPGRNNRRVYRTNATYIERVIEAGGMPLIIPSKIALEDCKQIVEEIDGLLVPGGGDILPSLFGEETHPAVVYALKDNDLFEMELVRLARDHNKPIIGICRGLQVINVAFGGTLYQDIATQYKNEICHRQSRENTDEPMHKVYLKEDSYISRILGKSIIDVNTLHHQSIKEMGEGLNNVGEAADGVIEAIESDDGMIVGVQWHPEMLAPKYKEFQSFFKDLVEKSYENQRVGKVKSYANM